MLIGIEPDQVREERAVRHWFALRRGGWTREQIVWSMLSEGEPITRTPTLAELYGGVSVVAAK